MFLSNSFAYCDKWFCTEYIVTLKLLLIWGHSIGGLCTTVSVNGAVISVLSCVLTVKLSGDINTRKIYEAWPGHTDIGVSEWGLALSLLCVQAILLCHWGILALYTCGLYITPPCHKMQIGMTSLDLWEDIEYSEVHSVSSTSEERQHLYVGKFPCLDLCSKWIYDHKNGDI